MNNRDTALAILYGILALIIIWLVVLGGLWVILSMNGAVILEPSVAKECLVRRL